MKPRQFIALLFLITAVGLGAYVAVSSWWQPPVAQLPMDASKLITAVQAFSRDRMDEALPIPETLTLRELIASGFLATNDAVAFEGMEVTFLMNADLSRPRETMIRVKMRDGSQLVLLANGEVQKVPR